MYVLGYDDHGLVHHLMRLHYLLPLELELPVESRIPPSSPRHSYYHHWLYLGRLVDTPPYLWFELIVTITTWYFAVWKQITTVDTTQNKYNAGLKQK